MIPLEFWIWFLACSVPVDLGFLIESSATESSKDFKKVLDFVNKVIESFQDENTHAAAIRYSDHAAVQFLLYNIRKPGAGKVSEKLNRISWREGWMDREGEARIDLALSLAQSVMFAGKLRSQRPKVWEVWGLRSRKPCLEINVPTRSSFIQKVAYKIVVLDRSKA